MDYESCVLQGQLQAGRLGGMPQPLVPLPAIAGGSKRQPPQVCVWGSSRRLALLSGGRGPNCNIWTLILGGQLLNLLLWASAGAPACCGSPRKKVVLVLLILPRPSSRPSPSRARVVPAVSDSEISHLGHSDPPQPRQQGAERRSAPASRRARWVGGAPAVGGQAMQHVREDPSPSLQRLILARRPWGSEHLGHGRQSPPRATRRSQPCDSSESVEAAYTAVWQRSQTRRRCPSACRR